MEIYIYEVKIHQFNQMHSFYSTRYLDRIQEGGEYFPFLAKSQDTLS